MKSLEILIAGYTPDIEKQIKQECENNGIVCNFHRNVSNKQFDLAIVNIKLLDIKKIDSLAKCSKKMYICTKSRSINIDVIKKLLNQDVLFVTEKQNNNVKFWRNELEAAFKTANTLKRIEQKIQKLSSISI